MGGAADRAGMFVGRVFGATVHATHEGVDDGDADFDRGKQDLKGSLEFLGTQVYQGPQTDFDAVEAEAMGGKLSTKAVNQLGGHGGGGGVHPLEITGRRGGASG